MQKVFNRIDTRHYMGYVVRIYVDTSTNVDFEWRVFTYGGEFKGKSDYTWNYPGQCLADAENFIDSEL